MRETLSCPSPLQGREVARVRGLQQHEVASVIVAPATPSSSLSRPGQLRNVKRLLAGKKWLEEVRILKVVSSYSFYVKPVHVYSQLGGCMGRARG